MNRIAMMAISPVSRIFRTWLPRRFLKDASAGASVPIV